MSVTQHPSPPEETPVRRARTVIGGFKIALGASGLLSGLGLLLLSSAWVNGQILKAEETYRQISPALADLMHRTLADAQQHHVGYGLFLAAVGAAQLAAGLGFILGRSWGPKLMLAVLVAAMPIGAVEILRDPAASTILFVLLDIAALAWFLRLRALLLGRRRQAGR